MLNRLRLFMTIRDDRNDQNDQNGDLDRATWQVQHKTGRHTN
ncbi:MAG: hypothetical protein AB7O32_12270 [Vicinamibacterales bacterium]